jgi:hypothetical protein
MKVIEFTTLALVQGNTYAPTQAVAFGDETLADSLVESGDAVPSSATIFVEHTDHTPAE